jgi:hypothetical protein
MIVPISAPICRRAVRSRPELITIPFKKIGWRATNFFIVHT